MCMCLCERRVFMLCGRPHASETGCARIAWCVFFFFTCMCAVANGVCRVCEVGKAVVSHPQASIACYHGSHTAGTPPPHVLLFFFLPTSLPYPLPPPPSPPLLFPLWLTDDSPTTTTNDITTPSLTLCCGESYCTLRFSRLLSSANQQGKPECHPFIHKIRLKSLKHLSLTTVTAYFSDVIHYNLYTVI